MPNKLPRRAFLRSSLVVGSGLFLSLRGLSWSRSQAAPLESPLVPDARQGLELKGWYAGIHDPVIIKAPDAYYVFCTGSGIPIRRSTDLIRWSIPMRAAALGRVPDWARELVPGQNDYWAPDISYFNDRYHLYYSVSTFGSNRSVIGLATNPTLDSSAPEYAWTDQGLVVQSQVTNNYNCIDPNVVLDADGAPWLSFGSFWSGIKMRRLDFETGKPSDEDDTLYSLARRTVNSGSVEAPFIVRKGDWYYLFVSFDFCCRGADSTYHVMVGRSESVTGPYMDRDGKAMLAGGGTQVTFPTERWRGPGHCAILQDTDADYIVYHAYDAQAQGAFSMHIDRLAWDAEGWPFIPVAERAG